MKSTNCHRVAHSTPHSTGPYPYTEGSRRRSLPAFHWMLAVVFGTATAVGLAGYLVLRSGMQTTSGIADPKADGGFEGTARQTQFAGRQPAFDLSNLTIAAGEIRAGGPPKDGIPALSDPKMITSVAAGYLDPDDRVIGYVEGDVARAYPLRVLNYHEVVNDRVAGKPIAVTYCPLCDSAAIFDRRTPLGEREFGVSGLLYNSNVLLYDRGGKPESLWSQVQAAGVSGPAANQRLTPLPVELTTWQDWLSRHPQTAVLSPNTGHRRDYQRSPYEGYFRTPRLMFPVANQSDQLAAKAAVLGVWVGDASRAYPVSALGGEIREIRDTLAGHQLTLAFEPNPARIRVVSADEGVQWMYSLWFAWYAFRPETEIFQLGTSPERLSLP